MHLSFTRTGHILHPLGSPDDNYLVCIAKIQCSSLFIATDANLKRLYLYDARRPYAQVRDEILGYHRNDLAIASIDLLDPGDGEDAVCGDVCVDDSGHDIYALIIKKDSAYIKVFKNLDRVLTYENQHYDIPKSDSPYVVLRNTTQPLKSLPMERCLGKPVIDSQFCYGSGLAYYNGVLYVLTRREVEYQIATSVRYDVLIGASKTNPIVQQEYKVIDDIWANYKSEFIPYSGNEPPSIGEHTNAINRQDKYSSSIGAYTPVIIPKGYRNVKLTSMSITSWTVYGVGGALDTINIFTRSGKHLIGTPIDTQGLWQSDLWMDSRVAYDNIPVTPDDMKTQLFDTSPVFESTAVYDGSVLNGVGGFLPPKPYDPANPYKVDLNGMTFQYAPTGWVGAVQVVLGQFCEYVEIPEVTEDLVLLVAGSGGFYMMASWDGTSSSSPLPPPPPPSVTRGVQHLRMVDKRTALVRFSLLTAINAEAGVVISNTYLTQPAFGDDMVEDGLLHGLSVYDGQLWAGYRWDVNLLPSDLTLWHLSEGKTSIPSGAPMFESVEEAADVIQEFVKYEYANVGNGTPLTTTSAMIQSTGPECASAYVEFMRLAKSQSAAAVQQATPMQQSRGPTMIVAYDLSHIKPDNTKVPTFSVINSVFPFDVSLPYSMTHDKAERKFYCVFGNQAWVFDCLDYTILVNHPDFPTIFAGDIVDMGDVLASHRQELQCFIRNDAAFTMYGVTLHVEVTKDDPRTEDLFLTQPPSSTGYKTLNLGDIPPGASLEFGTRVYSMGVQSWEDKTTHTIPLRIYYDVQHDDF